ncbi:MAG TPA: hypothetical protein VFH27_07055 [Longimicrobiaceae bacterium]|nr:hypothetical protein [Longimicrobiaceae bacterium]
MNKLRLDPDMLAVETFETLKAFEVEGTVQGYEATNRASCVHSCITSCGLAMDAACTCPIARG